MQASLEGLTLHVEDVERSLAFYRRLPGAALVHHRPGEFALLTIGSARLGLLARCFLGPGAPAFHLEVAAPEGVDQLYAAVRAAGFEPGGPPRDRPWGDRSFHVADPDGNLIEFDSNLDDGARG